MNVILLLINDMSLINTITITITTITTVSQVARLPGEERLCEAVREREGEL